MTLVPYDDMTKIPECLVMAGGIKKTYLWESIQFVVNIMKNLERDIRINKNNFIFLKFHITFH